MVDLKAPRTPSRMTVRIEAGCITAVNGRGDEIRLAASPSQHGFTPLELQSAALGICTAITLRDELARVAGTRAVPPFELAVQGAKADDQPSRLVRIEVSVTFPDGVPARERPGVLHRADAACTIANTLRSRPEISLDESKSSP
jgi:uncharacterized OsmC-like protein